MKKCIFLIVFFIVTFAYSQISVSSRHIGPSKKIPEEQLDKFKNSTTIFVLPNTIQKEKYQKILEDSWDVTPFELVAREDFDSGRFLNVNNSFVFVEGYRRTVYKNTYTREYIYIYLNFFMYDLEKLNKGLEKIKPGKKNTEEKIEELFEDCRMSFARVDLFPKDEFINLVLTSGKRSDEILQEAYTDDIFYNYSPGFLKNSLQKVNDLIKNEEEYWMYANDFKDELKNLVDHTLYIPSYHKILYDPLNIEDKEDTEKIEEILSSYDYNYEFLENEELDKKILSNEEFYYLKYVRTNSQKFFSIINAKSGEIIYRNYVAGIASSYNIKERHIKDLNSLIKKAVKKG